MVLVVSGLGAQVADHPHQRIGLPQDWTHSHVIFTRAAMNSYALAAAEPRVLHQWLRQNAGRMTLATQASETTSGDTKRDWSVPLGTARVAAGMFPAKYGFDTTAAPSCTNDYVAFGLNATGSATQANLIAFNQLYRGTPSGLCGTGNPAVLFSYNISTIGGRIATSPILSLDGTKIAFVETTSTAAVFHVLTWKTGAGNGTSATAPAVPGVGNTASMVNVSLGNTLVTRSSPWIDYSTDTVYVGNNGGAVNKITGVFKGTPTRAGAPWPVAASNRVLSAPVLDKVTGNIFVGDGDGALVSFNSITPGTPKKLAVGKAGATGANILDAPMVDSANGVVYAISSDDGTSAVLVQARTTNLTEVTRARMGVGSAGGANVAMYDGSPDDKYFSTSAGTFFVCGTATASTVPTLYGFGLNGATLNTSNPSTLQLSNQGNARCTPIIEFFNPSVSGGTDFLFFGLGTNCFGGGTSGCVISMTTSGTVLRVAEGNGPSGIVIDNQSSAGQASSIYFSNENTSANAVKLTQSTLQ
jgi:hypothetical protein